MCVCFPSTECFFDRVLPPPSLPPPSILHLCPGPGIRSPHREEGSSLGLCNEPGSLLRSKLSSEREEPLSSEREELYCPGPGRKHNLKLSRYPVVIAFQTEIASGFVFMHHLVHDQSRLDLCVSSCCSCSLSIEVVMF